MSKSVGNYNLLQKLGRGSFADVYYAEHKVSGQKFALKVIAKDKIFDSKNSKLQDSLDVEVTIMRDYRHDNIVCLYDYFSSARYIYLVLELCVGGDLSQFIKKRGRLEEHVAYKFLYQLTNGLQFLSEKNIIHRDMKPANILLSENSENAILKIADFGFARQLSEAASMAQTQCGTPLYMAPEIFENQEYDGKADIWSTGCIFYEMLTGLPPFRGLNAKDLLNNIRTKALVIPHDIKISSDSVLLLREMLTLNQSLRSNLADLHDAVLCLVENRPITAYEKRGPSSNPSSPIGSKGKKGMDRDFGMTKKESNPLSSSPPKPMPFPASVGESSNAKTKTPSSSSPLSSSVSSPTASPSPIGNLHANFQILNSQQSRPPNITSSTSPSTMTFAMNLPSTTFAATTATASVNGNGNGNVVNSFSSKNRGMMNIPSREEDPGNHPTGHQRRAQSLDGTSSLAFALAQEMANAQIDTHSPPQTTNQPYQSNVRASMTSGVAFSMNAAPPSNPNMSLWNQQQVNTVDRGNERYDSPLDTPSSSNQPVNGNIKASGHHRGRSVSVDPTFMMNHGISIDGMKQASQSTKQIYSASLGSNHSNHLNQSETSWGNASGDDDFVIVDHQTSSYHQSNHVFSGNFSTANKGQTQKTTSSNQLPSSSSSSSSYQPSQLYSHGHGHGYGQNQHHQQHPNHSKQQQIEDNIVLLPQKSFQIVPTMNNNNNNNNNHGIDESIDMTALIQSYVYTSEMVSKICSIGDSFIISCSQLSLNGPDNELHSNPSSFRVNSVDREIYDRYRIALSIYSYILNYIRSNVINKLNDITRRLPNPILIKLRHDFMTIFSQLISRSNQCLKKLQSISSSSSSFLGTGTGTSAPTTSTSYMSNFFPTSTATTSDKSNRSDKDIPTAEPILYCFAIKLARDAWVENLLGKFARAEKLYSDAKLVIECLYSTSIDSDDTRMLHHYAESLSRQINLIDKTKTSLNIS